MSEYTERWKWYLKWKMYLWKKNGAHVMRSPKTFNIILITGIFYSIYNGGGTQTLYFFALYLFYYIYIDFTRGVPRKWKNEVIRTEFNKRRLDENGNTNSAPGQR